jgi:hypothetical protein
MLCVGSVYINFIMHVLELSEAVGSASGCTGCTERLFDSFRL